ncbi:MAG TPA: AzlC family ABC transporter permease [Acidimicrobiales bacterium]|nr:AzlC family ABC transporter permease [Acidimicrobiales bacterium]
MLDKSGDNDYMGRGTTGRRGDPGGRRVVARALTIGAATGAYGLSFGAVSTAAGLDLLQTVALSLVMFTGASQFAFVGAVAGGGNPLAAAATAVLVGARNGLYGLRLAPVVRARGPRRLLAAHLTIDESTAMALGARDEREARLAFSATGLAVFVLWNLATLLGALGARAIPDPGAFGLDAAAPAAFVALVGPRLRSTEVWVLALGGAAVALCAVPFTPAGVPILVAGAIAVAASASRGDAREPGGRP